MSSNFVRRFQFAENVSSGSEHGGGGGAEDDVGDDCINLSELVNDFLMDEADSTDLPSAVVDEEEAESSSSSIDGSIVDWSRYTVQSKADSYRNSLYGHVMEGIEVFSYLEHEKQLLRRNLMAYLRNLGFNAAICKTKWGNSSGLTAGNYEFIDVLRSDSGDRIVRYIVDLDFATEFEIARPTAQYERIVKSIPKVFVGRVEDLKRNLNLLSDEAKQSMKNRGLHLPPWRKHRYMQNKWLGPHKRTTNLFPATSSSVLAPPPATATAKHHLLPVKCRAVGFETTAVKDRFVLPAITRTR